MVIASLAPSKHRQLRWSELQSKGYLLLPNFLSEADMTLLNEDFGSNDVRRNRNYDVTVASPMILEAFRHRMDEISGLAFEHTGVDTDITVGGIYFATERMNFPWHQDHESYFMFQNHRNALNFYIPFVKPDLRSSNVSVVPFDRLKIACPRQAGWFVGGGATRLQSTERDTLVTDNEGGGSFSLSCNLDALAETPQLHAGDLLLMRGDVIHRTQDADTRRVAISLRRQCSRDMVDRRRLQSGCSEKRAMIARNPQPYRAIARYLDGAPNQRMTIGDLVAQWSRDHTMSGE